MSARRPPTALPALLAVVLAVQAAAAALPHLHHGGHLPGRQVETGPSSGLAVHPPCLACALHAPVAAPGSALPLAADGHLSRLDPAPVATSDVPPALGSCRSRAPPPAG